MSSKLFGRDLKEYEDVDFMELLEKLTPEELRELSDEIDPDDSLLPPAERCRDQTTKDPTGPYDREKLLKFLEDKAKADADWKEAVPYEKKTRGKIFIEKKPEPTLSQQELAAMGIETEFDELCKDMWNAAMGDTMPISNRHILNEASEEDLVDLAAILECTGMLNQVQYHAGISSDTQQCGGFNGIARHEKFKLVPDEPPNDTDVVDSIKRLEANDPELTELNLNNIKNISAEQFGRLFGALKKNSTLKSLHCANTQTTVAIVRPIADTLRENTTLRSVNFESNFLTGDLIIEILQAVNVNQTVSELHFSNQRQKVFGVQVESKIAKLVQENKTLVRFGIDLETQPARIAVRDQLQKNMDRTTRKKRRSISEDN